MELIFLHGTAAAGKLTTARALEDLLGYPVFHNHLVVDALTAVFPFGSEPFVRLREEFWLQVFTDAARSARSLTFTFAPEATVQHGFPARARARVESSGGRICFVRLVVSESEQERRIGNQDRKQFHKLTDLSTLRRLRTDRNGVEQPPVELEIDTDTTTAEESAALIADHFRLTAQERMQRYPEP
ncbi:P-loop NTPase family protein [Microlunatus ginsengisoli]|jgi:chloramphenicol 3-O-phosphotransferase|uniref:Shikimate kinase n=1 Tax=Microlunatus ginsengisoli TaxID=363863 RepID=A0ABP7AU44_9ACTN